MVQYYTYINKEVLKKNKYSLKSKTSNNDKLTLARESANPCSNIVDSQ